MYAMMKEITKLCNKTWEMEEWPTNWERSIFIPMHAASKTEMLENVGTIEQ